jgi:biotin carboxyl carrier protein
VKVKITVDGQVYEVDVEAAEEQRDTPSIAAVPRPPAAPTPVAVPQVNTPVADDSKVCRSPVAGVVVKVFAQTGQSIQANDLLLLLEAMKMETSISSPMAGKVARVNVGVGDAVQGGQVVVEFE